MNPRKVLLIVGGLVLIAVVLMFLRGLSGKDTVRPTLDQIVATNAVIIGLSAAASQDASLYEVQTAAATLTATTTSDNLQLQAYYKDRYGKASKLAKELVPTTDVVKELKETPPGNSYDAKYEELTIAEIQKNLDSLRSAFEQSRNATLKDLLTKIYDSQEVAIRGLQALP
jgi:hypothetical protein